MSKDAAKEIYYCLFDGALQFEVTILGAAESLLLLRYVSGVQHCLAQRSTCTSPSACEAVGIDAGTALLAGLRFVNSTFQWSAQEKGILKNTKGTTLLINCLLRVSIMEKQSSY